MAKLGPPTEGKPKALGVNIFSGGFTLGVEQAGFSIEGQWEEGTAGATTFEMNYPDVPHPLSHDEWDFDAFAPGDLDLLYANPPCAPWSVIGSKLGSDDPRMSFTVNTMEAALRLEPTVFVLESVPRAWSENGGQGYYRQWANSFFDKGYAVTAFLTSAVLHGSPQVRERFHFVAHRLDIPWQVPEMDPEQVTTVRRSIEDLESLDNDDPNHVLPHFGQEARHVNVIDHTEQGESWTSGYERAAAKGLEAQKGRIISHRLRYDAPAGTIVDIHAMIHPTQRRVLTVREGARMCGYPDTFKFNPEPAKVGGRGSEVTQAVMVPVARYLGTEVQRALDIAEPITDEELDRREMRIVDWRKLGRQYRPRVFAETLKTWRGE